MPAFYRSLTPVAISDLLFYFLQWKKVITLVLFIAMQQNQATQLKTKDYKLKTSKGF